jgi:hypothetical protein
MAAIAFAHRDYRTDRRPPEWTPRVAGGPPIAFMPREAATLAGILETGSRNIGLCGPLTGLPDGFARAAASAGVRVESMKSAEGVILVLPDGVKLYVREASDWFGDAALDVETCRTAWGALLELLKLHTGLENNRWLMPLPTPALTGRAFFQTYMPHDMLFQRLTPEQRKIIMSPTPERGWRTFAPEQHRSEKFRTGGVLPGCWRFDHRHFYRTLGVAISLPEGGIEEQLGGEFRPFKPAWYEVEARVPDEWRHIGLVAADGQWIREPGRTFAAWVAEPEARLLFNFAETWRPIVKRRLAFALKDGSDRQGLKVAVAKIAAIERDGEHIPGIRYACRAILHNGIGSLHPAYQPRREEIHEHDDERLAAARAAGAKLRRNLKRLAYWIVEYPERKDEARDEAPQIAAHLWSEARRRVACAMLAIPFDDLVGVFGDQLYTTCPHEFPSHGVETAFRQTGFTPGPLRAPKSVAEMRGLFSEAA